MKNLNNQWRAMSCSVQNIRNWLLNTLLFSRPLAREALLLNFDRTSRIHRRPPACYLKYNLGARERAEGDKGHSGTAECHVSPPRSSHVWRN